MNAIRFTAMLIALFASSVFLASIAQGAVPQLMNYQGRLTDTTGKPLPDGNYSVTFRLYSDSVGGTNLWQEGRLLTVRDGLFDAALGSIQPFPDSAFSTALLWMGIQVGLEPEFQPRSRLVTVPYSFSSKRAGHADTAFKSLDKTVDATELVAGTLDTSRYSSYSDLLSEGRIGVGPSQLAVGDHIHSTSRSQMIRIANSDSAIRRVYAGTEVELKSITIPTNSLGHFLSIKSAFWISQAGTSVIYRIKINGIEVTKVGPPIVSAQRAVIAELVMSLGDSSPTSWLTFSPAGGESAQAITIDSSSPVIVSFTANLTAGGGYVDASCGVAIVIYDEMD